MIKQINDTVRFGIEVTSLILIIAAGFKNSLIISKLFLGVVIPVGLLFFWARFMAPLSVHRLVEWQRLIVEIILFGEVTYLTFTKDGQLLGSVYLTVVTVNSFLDHLLKN